MVTVAERARELDGRRRSFVRATVVRAQPPASARPGDQAIVSEDGSIDGFVGGVCAEGAVRTAALGTLRDGGPVLLRVLPEGEVTFPESPGARVVVNPCLSGGALEIFLEPRLPPPLIGVVGRTPIAEAVIAFARQLGYAATRAAPGELTERADSVIIASHGRDEAPALRAALDAGVPHIALVASPRRGAALLDELGFDDAERARISTPAGFDLGARTPAEIALSIMAESVAALRAGSAAPSPGGGTEVGGLPSEATDPVCGMAVTVVPGTPHLSVEGADVWFCGTGCRDRYAKTSTSTSTSTEAEGAVD
ncbi:XdhC family protein [Streptomyces sulphureus]|uniref:XdhC family protein n=1 Tax=Streptomyces sulphureus TaxID=47758 RepID=UPI00036BA9E2|nr:XdhC family protein [Streptomyces sulphureus]